MFGKTWRWRVEKGPAGGRQRAHLGRAVGQGIERGGAPGAVVAGLALALQQDDAMPAAQFGRHGCAGDTRAQDCYVKTRHGFRPGVACPLRPN